MSNFRGRVKLVKIALFLPLAYAIFMAMPLIDIIWRLKERLGRAFTTASGGRHG